MVLVIDMRLIGKPRLEQIKLLHPETRGLLDALCIEVERAQWRSFSSVLESYRLAEPVGEDLVVLRFMERRLCLQLSLRYQNQIAVVQDAFFTVEARQAA